MPKFIENALPLAEINEVAIREKSGKTGHPANLPMWWGRSPVASSIAALAAAVLENAEKSSPEGYGITCRGSFR